MQRRIERLRRRSQTRPNNCLLNSTQRRSMIKAVGSLHGAAASSLFFGLVRDNSGLRVLVLFGVSTRAAPLSRSFHIPNLLGGALYQTQLVLQPTVPRSSLGFDLCRTRLGRNLFPDLRPGEAILPFPRRSGFPLSTSAAIDKRASVLPPRGLSLRRRAASGRAPSF